WESDCSGVVRFEDVASVVLSFGFLRVCFGGVRRELGVSGVRVLSQMGSLEVSSTSLAFHRSEFEVVRLTCSLAKVAEDFLECGIFHMILCCHGQVNSTLLL
ncbi:hypothetical protein M758_1G121800, partial [Ceratodon purpureus]